VTRLRMTSPGILLILAVVAAGGILLLDASYLRPNVESHKWAALREQALRAENAARLALRAEEEGLHHACAAWAQTQQVGAFLKTRTSPDKVDAFIRQALASSEVDIAWLCDANANVLRAWSHSTLPDADATARREAGEIVSTVTELGKEEGRKPAGLVKAGDRAMIFGYQAMPDEQDPSRASGRLWLARYLSSDLMERINTTVGGNVVLVAADSLPNVATVHDESTHTMWMMDEDRLAVAWPASDVAGKNLGYFRVELSVSQIHRQAVTSRRMVLIILSLSVGLALLVIVGTHILVTGPVVRLLRRLQELESGERGSKDLARDLHGEPLMLARRLESAFDKLAHMTKTDQLTGLSNRRHFEEVLEAFYHQARRYNRPLSLIVMDIDFFKAINDTGGHQAGDDLIKVVADEIEDACRKADLPARFGGDEFAVLLPETAAGEAAIVAERIRQQIGGRQISLGALQIHVTISAGITDLNAGEMDSPQSMLALGDRALYTAKETGRNRVVQAHDLNGVNWKDAGEQNKKVDTLCRKLAGLDNQFKDVFLKAVEEIVVILEQRDPHMADHARKVQRYASLIAGEMELPERVIQRIQIAAMLHDIGMLAMPDAVLLCPGGLNEQQVQTMRKHTLMGVRIMEGMEFLEQEIPAVRYHHERWDGRGYPEGIAGSAIPLTARILAVADAFDAMTSPRTFRSAKTRVEAIQELKASVGRQFDSAVVDAFLAVAGRMGEDLMGPPSRQSRALDESPPLDLPEGQPNVQATWKEERTPATGGPPRGS